MTQILLTTGTQLALFVPFPRLQSVLATWLIPALKPVWLDGIRALGPCACATARIIFCVCARDIVLQHMWNGTTAGEEPLQLNRSPEQLKAEGALAEGRRNNAGMTCICKARFFPTCRAL